MRNVYDVAKYFIKNDADSLLNTYEGNMKLQSLLVFANMINVAEYGELLFDDVLALKDDCVVEKVSLCYESDKFEQDFSDREYTVLIMVMSIFKSASVKELSELIRTFNFWKETNCLYKSELILHDEDIDRMKEIVHAYQESSNDVMTREITNGISFYYNGFQLTDEIIEELTSFTFNADDDSYIVYLDDGSLVVY